MIRPPLDPRGFAPGLFASTAIHAALMALLFIFAAGSDPLHLRNGDESCITAFLVTGTGSAAAKPAAVPDRAPLSPRRAVTVHGVAEPDRQPREQAPPAQQEAQPETPALRLQDEPEVEGQKGGVAAEAVSSSATIPETGDTEVGTDPGLALSLPAEGEAQTGNGKNPPVSPQEGTAEPRTGGEAVPPKDADAVPRYGDNVLPVYPPLARLRGYQGVTTLLVEVLADGRTGHVRVGKSAGHEILDRAALDAVRTWRFEPGWKDGRPVAMSVAVPVRFMLKGTSILVKTDQRR